MLHKCYFVLTACLRAMEEQFRNGLLNTTVRIPRVKCDGTRAENRFRLSAKRTSPFNWQGGVSSVDYWQPSVRISGSNAGYIMFRISMKGTGYPLHSPVSPSLPLPCVTVCHHISTWVYNKRFSILIPPSPPTLLNHSAHVVPRHLTHANSEHSMQTNPWRILITPKRRDGYVGRVIGLRTSRLRSLGSIIRRGTRFIASSKYEDPVWSPTSLLFRDTSCYFSGDKKARASV